MKVIGLGLGRTGTYSLKLALERLGFGPCHHMETVLQNAAVQVPLWTAALDGRADWPALYSGVNSAVDWPTAAFVPELVKAYPSAKFLLTLRDPGSWADSFGATIYTLLGQGTEVPPAMEAWFGMARGVIARSGVRGGLDRDGLITVFKAHSDAVRRTVPADRLLVYEVREGWGPLCGFLGTPVPGEEFPRSNDRAEFWELVKRSL
jgi:hypothetical protein